MSQESSNQGPHNQGDPHNSPQNTQDPVVNATNEENMTPRDKHLMNMMMETMRNTFELFRKEKATGEGSSNPAKFVTFKSFKAQGATEFEGLTDPVAALMWLENTEKCFRIARVDVKDETVYASSLFTKQALTWWNNVGKAMGVKVRDDMSFEEFKKLFLDQYCPKDMRRRLEKEFLEIKQGEMTVSEYEKVFNEKSQFALKYIPTEEEKIDIFVEGLRYEIKDFVSMREVPTFVKAVEYARKREHELDVRGALVSASKRQRVEPSNSVSPVLSHQDISHDESHLFSIPSDTPRSCQRCGKHHYGRCEVIRGSINCYGCGKEGHIRSMCPERNTKCFSCGGEGHRKKNCPTARRQATESRASVQQPTRAGSSIQKEEVPQAKSRVYQITPDDKD